jgi:PRTRC genetic system protein B
MNDIMENFGTLYHPVSALVFYQAERHHKDIYVEYFDMDKNGLPINAHPLTVKESKQLATALKVAREKKEPCLKCEGVMESRILHIDAVYGRAAWFTKAMQRELFFTESLGIPKGRANVPPMLWIATRHRLTVFALDSNRRPTLNTKLYHAPFFNVYENGEVCMGTVDVRIKKTASVEEFTSAWESYFFQSYFSHLLKDHNPIKGNPVSLWENLIATGETFPKEVLKTTMNTLKNLL